MCATCSPSIPIAGVRRTCARPGSLPKRWAAGTGRATGWVATSAVTTSRRAQPWAATGDDRLRDRIERVLDLRQRCQQAVGTGFIGDVPAGAALGVELAAGVLDADTFNLNGRWFPLYSLHKTVADSSTRPPSVRPSVRRRWPRPGPTGGWRSAGRSSTTPSRRC